MEVGTQVCVCTRLGCGPRPRCSKRCRHKLLAALTCWLLAAAVGGISGGEAYECFAAVNASGGKGRARCPWARGVAESRAFDKMCTRHTYTQHSMGEAMEAGSTPRRRAVTGGKCCCSQSLRETWTPSGPRRPRLAPPHRSGQHRCPPAAHSHSHLYNESCSGGPGAALRCPNTCTWASPCPSVLFFESLVAGGSPCPLTTLTHTCTERQWRPRTTPAYNTHVQHSTQRLRAGPGDELRTGPRCRSILLIARLGRGPPWTPFPPRTPRGPPSQQRKSRGAPAAVKRRQRQRIGPTTWPPVPRGAGQPNRSAPCLSLHNAVTMPHGMLG